MVKREWIGKPIDATMQYITERPHRGESVAGTTEDDMGEEMTDAIPSFVNRSEYNETQLEIIQNKILYPNLSLKELTEKFDYSYTKTSSFLAGFREEHEEELKEAGLFEKMRFPRSPPKREASSGSKAERERKQAFEFFKEHPNATISDAQAVLDLDSLSQSQLAGAKGNARQSLLSEGIDPDRMGAYGEVEMERELEIEMEQEVPFDRTTERELTASPESNGSNGLVTVELKSDSLFSILTSDELPEDERKEIFEQVVEGASG